MSLIVTVLTGRRPHLLERTLKAAETHIGDVLAESRKYLLINGGDEATRAVVRQDRIWGGLWAVEDQWRSIGAAISGLAWVAGAIDADYWLHLEDDWECLSSPEGWLEESIALLDSGKVDQIRLRDASEKVLTKHMVTGKPIRWTQEGHFDIGEAHLTFNPFLMRTTDIKDAFPCTGERDAQRKWLAAGHKIVAQHHPGLFRHIGGGESLRGKQS
jgi:hypothetical protein